MKLKNYTIPAVSVFALMLTLLVSLTYGEKDRDSYKGEEEEHERESAAGFIQWRQQILANQVTGTYDGAEIARMNRQIDARAAQNKTNAAFTWTELGPDNAGGRTRAVLVDKDSSNIVFAGSVAGGLWRSNTAGASWTRVNDQMACLSIGSLTQGADGAIYAGTGEGGIINSGGITSFSVGFDGIGVYKSTDGGKTFNLLSSTDATQAGKSFWQNTSDMKADPVNAGRIYAGNGNGLYVTNDGGTSWGKATGSSSGNCTDIDISKDGSVIVAVIGTNINISIDGGASFRNASPTSGPSGVWGGTPRRVSVAIANSDNNYIYAMASNNTNDRTLSMVQSKDKGVTWTRIVTGSTPYVDVLGSDLQGQGYWNNVTAVDPDDREHVYFGGIDLWDWTPTAGIAPISVWSSSKYSPKYVHADNHAIVWDLKTTPATMYIGNDGGVFKSRDKGKNFYSSNHGYSVTQFYGVAAAFVNDDIRSNWIVGGGSQDNGTWIIDGLGNTPMSGVYSKGGDGFNAEFSKKIPGYAILSSYDSDLSSYLKFVSRDNDASQKYDQTFYDTRVAAYCKDSGLFNTPFNLWETNTRDSISLFLFSGRGASWIAKDIYKDLSKTPTWYRVMNFGGSGSCVDISQDGNTALIGTSAGVVYKVDSILTKGIFDSASGTLTNTNISVVFTSGQFINGVSFCKTDKNKAVITLGNYGNNNYVYYSSNLMSSSPTFASIQGTGTNALPKLPVYDGEMLWDDPSILVLATERGVWVSRNFTSGSPTWTLENGGMANVAAFQIRQYKYNNWPGSRLYIATHGRGFFVSTTYANTGVNAIKDKIASLSVFPNPCKTVATFTFNNVKAGQAEVSVYNLQGQLIRNEVVNATSGINNYSFYVEGLSNGTYIAIVNHNGIKESQKFMVVK